MDRIGSYLKSEPFVLVQIKIDKLLSYAHKTELTGYTFISANMASFLDT